MSIIVTTEPKSMSLKEFWYDTGYTPGIPSEHLCKQSKRQLCSFDQKYKQKNKLIFKVMLKFPCGTQRKSSVTGYFVYVSEAAVSAERETFLNFHSFTLPACFSLAINSKK